MAVVAQTIKVVGYNVVGMLGVQAQAPPDWHRWAIEQGYWLTLCSDPPWICVK